MEIHNIFKISGRNSAFGTNQQCKRAKSQRDGQQQDHWRKVNHRQQLSFGADPESTNPVMSWIPSSIIIPS